METYFFGKINNYKLTLAFIGDLFIYFRIYIFILHYFYLFTYINYIIFTLRNVKYQFNTKYSNNNHIMLNSNMLTIGYVKNSTQIF